MKTLKFVVPALVLALGMIMSTATSSAKPAYAKKEGKTCTFCHVKAGQKDLNDTGKCYQEHDHSLDKCQAK
ncbi:MAG: hypothetical protein ABSG25_00260 [Bryobacteraceae bacterium]|jgi:hypothetical protein